MKKIIIFFFILLLIWIFHPLILPSSIWLDNTKIPEDPNAKFNEKIDYPHDFQKELAPVKDVQEKKELSKFKCDRRKYCSQMHSYEEAKYFLDYCGPVYMDGDGDGIPCERQFGHH